MTEESVCSTRYVMVLNPATLYIRIISLLCSVTCDQLPHIVTRQHYTDACSLTKEHIPMGTRYIMLVSTWTTLQPDRLGHGGV
ncbi:hypothetical protein Pcinc_018923 [Petrolisthes cinctipes]|uniref:Uncharacterized protein n=1 Tax=Petrolisthes cinctipes TaxID=88211 RepID=A0AAE1KM62_PETCI|nr:hypothetical protein Pcinc_018923 [Petrolisthes cinctipes]